MSIIPKFDTTESVPQEPLLITGIADFIQVYMTYETKPSKNEVVFQFKLINITSLLLEYVKVRF